MKFNISKEWLQSKAHLEEGCEIGAGVPPNQLTQMSDQSDIEPSIQQQARTAWNGLIESMAKYACLEVASERDDLRAQLALRDEETARLELVRQNAQHSANLWQSVAEDREKANDQLHVRLEVTSKALGEIQKQLEDELSSSEDLRARLDEAETRRKNEEDTFAAWQRNAQTRLAEATSDIQDKNKLIEHDTKAILAIESQCQKMRDIIQRAKGPLENGRFDDPSEVSDLLTDIAAMPPLDLELMNQVKTVLRDVLSYGDSAHDLQRVVEELLKSLSPAPNS